MLHVLNQKLGFFPFLILKNVLFPNGNLKIYHCVYKATRYTRKKNGKDKRTFVREGLRAFGHIPTIHYMILQGPLYCHLIKVQSILDMYIQIIFYWGKVKKLWEGQKIWKNYPPVFTNQLLLLSSVKTCGRQHLKLSSA